MSTPEPMPRDFGLRWILWWGWCNAISILTTFQAVLAAVTLDPSLLPHDLVHYAMIANCVLTIVIAQTKKNSPPPPPPVQGQAYSTLIKQPKETA